MSLFQHALQCSSKGRPPSNMDLACPGHSPQPEQRLYRSCIPGMLLVQTYDGWTALHEICCLGSTDIALALLKRGAEVHASCKYDNTYAHVEQGHFTCAE